MDNNTTERIITEIINNPIIVRDKVEKAKRYILISKMLLSTSLKYYKNYIKIASNLNYTGYLKKYTEINKSYNGLICKEQDKFSYEDKVDERMNLSTLFSIEKSKKDIGFECSLMLSIIPGIYDSKKDFSYLNIFIGGLIDTIELHTSNGPIFDDIFNSSINKQNFDEYFSLSYSIEKCEKLADDFMNKLVIIIERYLFFMEKLKKELLDILSYYHLISKKELDDAKKESNIYNEYMEKKNDIWNTTYQELDSYTLIFKKWGF